MLYIINAAYVNVLKCSVNKGTYFPNYNHFTAFVINQIELYIIKFGSLVYMSCFRIRNSVLFFIDPGYHKDYSKVKLKFSKVHSFNWGFSGHLLSFFI